MFGCLINISLFILGASVVFAQELNNIVADDALRKSHINFTLVATLKRIVDGDTVTLEGRNKALFKIRLSDMDTPEIEHAEFTPRGGQTVPFRPGQPGGKAATEALKKLLSVGDSVVAECYEIGRYGRNICHIFKGRTNINLEMIKNGWGWLPRNKQFDFKTIWIKDPASYEAERLAKQKSLGAWGLPRQVLPRQWRIDCWANGKCEGAEQ